MAAASRSAGGQRLRCPGAVALCIAALAVASGEGRAAQRCEPAIAHVASIQGEVEIRPVGLDPWRAAALGDAVCLGDTVRVGRLSRAALALANDSVLRLDQRTTLRLRSGAEPQTSIVDLLLGALYLFSRRPRALEVDTPFVNAGVRGTEFLVRVGDDRTLIIVLDGRVLAGNPEGELRLASGEAGLARAGEPPRRELVARPRDAVAWTLHYPPILSALAAGGPEAPPLPAALAMLDEVPPVARDARYWTHRAGLLLNVGRADEARAAIARALALDPEAGEGLAQRAVIELAQSRREAALADARRAVDLSPDSAPARVALSYALQASFELEQAREVLREAVQRMPDDPLLWARLAELELSFGNLDAAEEAAGRAVALAPELARTQMVLGFAALARIDVDEAEEAFERAIALDSTDPLPRLGLGLARIRQSDLEAGRREIEIAAGLDPSSSLIRSYLGKAYFEERRDALAADQFRLAKELDPNDPTPWLYDAIRKQAENRPVEALRDLERSVALNDNRAVYRSRLLLDQDLATRSVSLARIYDDLGFDRVALVEATESLSQDPANWSAHRFLSDAYARQPRHEIARASELLQAQLLQPININPIQPSLPITDLNVVSGIGPAEGAFNEFHPLFERDRAQLTATGVLGSNDTLGDEIVASVLWNRLSFSAGQFHSETDGFRDDNDVENDLYDLFAQVAVTPSFSLQSEFRRRDAEEGDLALRFDPDFVLDFFRRELNQDVARFGARWAPSPRLDAIASVFYTDRNEEFPAFGEAEDRGYQAEAQLLYGGDRFNAMLGGGRYDIDVDETFFGSTRQFTREQDNVHAYTNFVVPTDVTWTVGLSYDRFEEDRLDVDKLNPKLGVEWSITDNVRFRAALFQAVKRALAAQQTIEPTQVAGFNQFFDDFNGTKALRYGAGLDVDLTNDLFVGLEVSRRELDVPVFTASGFVTENQEEDLLRAYAYWAPYPRWAFSVEYAFDRFESEESADPDFPRDVRTMSVPLAARYFDPLGFFAELRSTFVNQDMDRQSGSLEGEDNFVLLDATVGYRLPKRVGIVSLEGLNLLDKGFKFQDDSFRTAETRRPLFIPDRTVLARLTLNF